MSLKARDVMHNLQYATDEMVQHEDIINQMTGCNLIDGTNNQSQYSAGFDNKVYGMGISGIPNHEILLASDNKSYNNIMKTYLQDADTTQFNIASSGVPSYFTTVWTNKTIKQLIQTTPFFQVSETFQQGMWGTTNIKMPTRGITGNAVIYGDNNGGGSTGVNYDWVDRQTITLQQILYFGDLSAATFAMAKIDYLSSLREALATKINLDINQIGFLGFAGRKLYGLKNDPSLTPAFSFPVSVSNPDSSLWAYKTGPEIISDIQSLHTQITSNAMGNANPSEEESILLLAPTCYNYLNQPASASLVTISIKEYLKQTYPKMKIIQVQNYQGEGSPVGSTVPNYCQLIYKSLNVQSVVYNCFSSLWHSHGVIRGSSSYNEKVSYTIAGAIIALPLGVATAYGN